MNKSDKAWRRKWRQRARAAATAQAAQREAIRRRQPGYVLGRSLMDQHGLTDWKLDICNLDRGAVTLLGFCHREEKTIMIDVRLRRSALRQTILHEIAHAPLPHVEENGDLGHGSIWRAKAREIGCSYKHVSVYLWREIAKGMGGNK